MIARWPLKAGHNVIAFPRAPERFWRVVPTTGAAWRGELIERGRLIRTTEAGALCLVRIAVQEHRQFLPVIDDPQHQLGRAA